eukprot:CAMPEP_0194777322 /NCGR_PEP_ID=MMETSP0323_2-20130528/65360_1 /TAXON_ID=2866 ORGANISM="Crypthecodinium cohnii, Strain Seligo" /NCGR_SAMPLE_ID=MMETSP0323_2 /ASSEMBLY_ACC=CAM_ASM_000346 /LENGTH=57 /DNA_ID=CAMNT_0039714077 /DNA_START=114 /DNA_END=287 /DNA_ORIENTATION=+
MTPDTGLGIFIVNPALSAPFRENVLTVDSVDPTGHLRSAVGFTTCHPICASACGPAR